MSLPVEIAERIKELNSKRPLRVHDPVVKPGDVRAVRSANTPCVCLVVWTSANNTAQITVVHPYTEMATSSDIVIPKTALSHSPGYDIVIQTSLRAAVHLTQLSEWVLARVPDDILDFYWKSSSSAIPEELGVYRGTTSIGYFDARHDFKKEMIKALSDLSSDDDNSSY